MIRLGRQYRGWGWEMGQRYGDPYEAIIAGSDCIIVGSGIHRAENPSDVAKEYAKLSWKGLLDR